MEFAARTIRSPLPRLVPPNFTTTRMLPPGGSGDRARALAWIPSPCVRVSLPRGCPSVGITVFIVSAHGTQFIRLPSVGAHMEVRDAIEEDAPRLGELAEGPTDVMRNLVHDRTVRVAVAEDDGAHEGERDGDEDVIGFVSFDAREGVVHVTQLAGPADVCQRLLDEPVRFAEREGMAVELLVPEGEETMREAAEAADFTEAGSGPQFAGTPTTRYRREVEPTLQ